VVLNLSAIVIVNLLLIVKMPKFMLTIFLFKTYTWCRLELVLLFSFDNFCCG
jgi:hypothetical protein